MSIVVAALKEGKVTIAADSQTNFGSLKVGQKLMADHHKLHKVGDSYIGLVGWSATSQILEHLMQNQPELFKLKSRMDIFETLLALQSKLKELYFIETREDEEEQPVESNQLEGLIINDQGLFSFGSFREVHQFHQYWAAGSGKRIAMGAMHAMYDTAASSEEIAAAGVNAACDLDESCALPMVSFTLELDGKTQ